MIDPAKVYYALVHRDEEDGGWKVADMLGYLKAVGTWEAKEMQQWWKQHTEGQYFYDKEDIGDIIGAIYERDGFD